MVGKGVGQRSGMGVLPLAAPCVLYTTTAYVDWQHTNIWPTCKHIDIYKASKQSKAFRSYAKYGYEPAVYHSGMHLSLMYAEQRILQGDHTDA